LRTSVAHNTAQNSSDNFPRFLQTIIIAQMLSNGGGGASQRQITREYNLSYAHLTYFAPATLTLTWWPWYSTLA